ncbi:MAG TPA: hypothetical protein VFQ53_18775 [Kofleriaceae bacterium]|nr:hypothetical protein [Kofleriaceae bacterium]
MSGSHRGVAQDYIVLPEGGELTAQMRFVTSEPMLGGEPLRFSDLALFGISGRWSLFSKLELSGEVTLLPKQPSYTDEKPWQSVGGTLRSPLGKRVALAISGAGGHLIDHEGKWLREAMTLQWRKRIDEIMTFDISAGIDGVGITAPDASSAFMTEVALGTSALFREPSGHWGAWVGIAYAVPVTASGSDPTTGLTIDPQPRLDLRVGTVLSLVRAWDVFAEFAVIDRGDLADPTTRLPILDGGFDQRQIMLGVTRHIDAPKKRRHDPMELSVR